METRCGRGGSSKEVKSKSTFAFRISNDPKFTVIANRMTDRQRMSKDTLAFRNDRSLAVLTAGPSLFNRQSLFHTLLVFVLPLDP